MKWLRIENILISFILMSYMTCGLLLQ